MTIRHSGHLKNKIFINHKCWHITRTYTNRLKKKMISTKDHHGNEHARWRDLKIDFRNTHGAFAIIRNPWDRVVSRYMFAKKLIEIEKTLPIGYADVSSFEAFLEERFKWAGEEFMWHRAIRGWYPAWDHVSDEKGLECKTDNIRFGHLNEDMCKYFNLKNMSPARNVTDFMKEGETYRNQYTDKTIQIIADWYKKDIDYWGFDFDTEATKNYWNK